VPPAPPNPPFPIATRAAHRRAILCAPAWVLTAWLIGSPTRAQVPTGPVYIPSPAPVPNTAAVPMPSGALAPAQFPQVPQESTRQVTFFGILATPNDPTIDPKLRPIAPQLRRLFPGHGFRMLGVETRRIETGQVVDCDLGGGFAGHATLLDPMDANGKVQLRVQLDQNEQIDFATLVSTPLNQLFFCEKRLNDGSRLVLGIGARP
jgi:hypothetical protein